LGGAVGFGSRFGVKGLRLCADGRAEMPVVNVDKRFNHLAKMFRRRELPSMLDITVKQRSPLQGFE
jgi:hypothetical protein